MNRNLPEEFLYSSRFIDKVRICWLLIGMGLGIAVSFLYVVSHYELIRI